jgi:MYXO-CTERM domain-containing protein
MLGKLSPLKVSALTALFLALLWPPLASAKEAFAVRACGDSGCALTTDRTTLPRFMSGLDGSPAPVEAPVPAPYVRVDLVIGAEGQPVEDAWTFYYLPQESLMATNGEPGNIYWYPVSRKARAAFRAISDGIVPFAPPAEWPRQIEQSRDLVTDLAGGTTTAAREDNAAGALPQTGASSGAETQTEPPVSAQTQAAAQTSVDTQAADPTSAETGGGGPWSNWFILPLAAIAVAGAAVLARRR